MGQFLRIVIVLVGLWVVLRLLRRVRVHRKTGPTAPPAPADMLRCKYCGVFVTREDAIAANDRHYCCEAHAEADRKRS